MWKYKSVREVRAAQIALGDAVLAKKLWLHFPPQNGLNFDWSDGTKSSFTFWKDDESSILGDCVFADTSGRWSSTACESFLQGAICHVPTGRFNSIQLNKYVLAPTACKALC